MGANTDKFFGRTRTFSFFNRLFRYRYFHFETGKFDNTYKNQKQRDLLSLSCYELTELIGTLRATNKEGENEINRLQTSVSMLQEKCNALLEEIQDATT